MRNRVVLIVALFIPVLFAFRSFFGGSSLSFGDAPHFWYEEVKELLSIEPLAWISRGNNFGGVNRFLWFFPLMSMWGVMGSILNLDSGVIIRLIFYFPSLVLSVVTPFLLTYYLGYSRRVQLFSVLVYSLNTYYLLLVDGGVVGVALAYGLFPLVLLFFKKYLKTGSFKQALHLIIALSILTMVDPRIGVICAMAGIFWGFLERSKQLKTIPVILLLVAGINAYWIIPLQRFGISGLSTTVSNLGLTSVLHSLTLFQPHWPDNVFGNINYPYFYFVAFPILIIVGLLKDKIDKKHFNILLLFLVFAFLAKGETAPFGETYSYVVENIPFGFAFRDSTKFFIPTILFAGILIGNTIDKINKLAFSASVYLFVLITVIPAVTGELNFVLSGRKDSEDYKAVYEYLNKEEGFLRTVWFPEKHALSFETEEKPALDAKELTSHKPFADINTGSYDLFNFLNNEIYRDWFEILGIKYLILSGDHRTPKLNEEQQNNWSNLNQLIATQSGLIKKDWIDEIAIFEMDRETRPHLYAVDKALFVLGDNPLEREFKNTAVIHLEDGGYDPTHLVYVSTDSARLVFNQKDEIDLTMSFLQDYFVGADTATKSEWGYYSSNEYLASQYQLLIRDINYQELEYGKGFAISTSEGERIMFKFKVPEDGDYVLGVRYLTDDKSPNVFVNGSTLVDNKPRESYKWITQELTLEKGQLSVELEGSGDVNLVNVIALVPKQEWIVALRNKDTLIENFGLIKIDGGVDAEELREFVKDANWHKIEFNREKTFRYTIVPPEGANWIVFTDLYNSNWKLKQGNLYHNSFPLYSMVNGFYTKPGWTKTEIVFEGQKDVRWGIYYSVLTVLGLAIISLWVMGKGNKDR